MSAEQPMHRTGLTPRVERRVQGDFPGEFQLVDDILSRLRVDTADPERIVAAVVLAADGELSGLVRAVELANGHPNELLVEAELAHPDWPQRLDDTLGPAD
jgi:hypothetical protein